MSSDGIKVNSVTWGVSECDPIPLSVSNDGTRRLVFLPFIHNNQHKNGSVNGAFVYQRKLKADEWEKITYEDEKLSKLKAGEGYRLDISTDELTKLKQGLADIEEIAPEVKKGRTNTTFIPSASDVAPLLKQLMANSSDDELLKELFDLGTENALRINDLVLNARIRSALKYWMEHRDNASEGDWQTFFTGRPWILSLISSEPIVLLQDKMFVGGTNASGKGGRSIDYAYINKQTNNIAFIEIKTPKMPLLGESYRGLYKPGSELTGSVVQVQNYKYSVLKNIRQVTEDYQDFDAVNIPTYVLGGDTKEMEGETVKLRSFELYRKNLKDTCVITYDELFERLKILLER